MSALDQVPAGPIREYLRAMLQDLEKRRETVESLRECSAELNRLRHLIQDMDRVLDEHRAMVFLIRECLQSEGPLSDELKIRLRESPAVTYGVLEECGCCGDLVRLSETTLNGAQTLCPNCK